MGEKGFSRRVFLKGLGSGVVGLSLNLLVPQTTVKVMARSTARSTLEGYPYQSWEDLYREVWKWDRIVKVTHPRNCWYQAHCSFDAYIKDGIVLREEQSADYPQTNPELPDFNPRGCQKGCDYSHRMYDPCRIKYPLKRKGERGEGKWERVSWDAALNEIADIMLDVITQEGVDRIIHDFGSGSSFGPQGMGVFRLKNLLGFPLLDLNPEIGDDHQGWAVTTGTMIGCCSADNWFYSDLFLLWGGNPHYTGIPYSHFLWEARYNGTKVVSISPDYNARSIHADLWVPIKVGTDAALALGMAQVIVAERLYNKGFIKEQTDLPLLVRDDTKRFLRERDLAEGGKDDRFYFYDLVTKGMRQVPQESLSLGDIDPVLEGSFEIESPTGKLRVQPIFELLKERLKEYTPERVSEITGISPDIIRALARDMARARSVTHISTSNFSKFYHGDLIERAQVLLFALCGHLGKKGSGFNAFPLLHDDAVMQMSLAPPGLPLNQAMESLFKYQESLIKPYQEAGYTDEMISYEFGREIYKRGEIVSSVLFWYIHGGLREISGRSKEWDKTLNRSVDEYLKESLDKGWQYINPAPDKEPRIFFELGGNIIRRVRSYPALLKTLWPKLRLIVTVDWRMSSTALYSDFVPPAAAFYEKADWVGWVGPHQPFFQITNRAVEPLHESKSEWEIYCLLAKEFQERAKARGITQFKDWQGRERKLDTLYDDLTFQGHYSEKSDEDICRDALKFSQCVKASWEDLKEKGWTRWGNLGSSWVSIGNSCDIKPGEPLVPYTWHTEKKVPWATLTRRMQFYIDQELYLEMGEELPVYKEPPKAGGDYPLVLTGGHTRWSIHSYWRDDPYMLRLQRGVPVIYISQKDAQKQGIRDGEEVIVKNDLDSFRIMAKVSPAIQPGQVVIYHAWEQYQFKNGKMFQNLIPSPIKPTELAGGYFHLRPYFFQLNPGQSDRDTRVEVIKLT